MRHMNISHMNVLLYFLADRHHVKNWQQRGVYRIRTTKHSFPLWSRTVLVNQRPSWGRYLFILRITSEIIAPLSSVTLSGTHFSKYGAWTGGVIDAIALNCTSTSLVRVKEEARNNSFHEKASVFSSLLFLKQLLPCCRTSITIPLVPNSQKRCHAFRQDSEDRSERGLSSFNNLWHLTVLSRRNFLLPPFSSLSSRFPLKNIHTCGKKLSHRCWSIKLNDTAWLLSLPKSD